ncbi:MAG: glutathione S-transferase family protein [Alphaproteobacteria bacterium]|nr:glutathione S-transferase family protein [Alphaproteobacteria bacterium]
MSSQEAYRLYGSYVSYHTAKIRSYLRKKGIVFTEHIPGEPRFRAHVRKSSGSHRIPQIELPDGSVVQDTVAIFDCLEARHPHPAARPPGLRQQCAARLLEVLIDPALGRTAWHYRWNYMPENYGFVGREFGRSFKPRGTDADLDHYGRIIADRMESKRGNFEDSPQVRTVLEDIYFDTLSILERQFTDHPYLFGGLPSVADHVLMGPLFGHLARDPYPSTLMKQRAPRVFRWTEHMNTPELTMPELADAEPAFAPDDEIPPATLELLRLSLADCGEFFVQSAEAFNAWAPSASERPAGAFIADDEDEPLVGQFIRELRGLKVQGSANTYWLWVLQRVLDWFGELSESDRATCRQLLDDCGGGGLFDIRLKRRLTRRDNRVAFA